MVRGMEITSGLKVQIEKNIFAKLISTEIFIRLTDEFEIIINNADSVWLSIQFKQKSDVSDWNRFANVTHLLWGAIEELQ